MRALNPKKQAEVIQPDLMKVTNKTEKKTVLRINY